MPADDVQQELLVIFHVGSLDAEQIVETSRNVIAFSHFGHLLHHVCEGLGQFAAEPAQFYRTEYRKALVQFLGIEDGGVLLDVSQPFQPLDPLGGGRRGQVDPGCQLLVAQSGIFLQGAQDVFVPFVELI